jgi:NADPH2:quinone reductase
VTNGALMRKSQAVVGFWLMHCLGRRDMIEEPLADLFERAASGELRPVIGTTYPLSDVQRAHKDLQGRRTHGKVLLDPAA